MLKKLQLLLFVSIAAVNIANAQVGQGALKGKIIDKETNEPVPFANVAVFLNGNQISGATTDFDGVFFVKPLPPGKYEVKATYVGYQPAGISGVVVKADQTSYQDIKISQGVQLSEFEYVEYEVPLINKNGGSDATVTREEIAKMPGRSAESVAITVGGVYSADGERGSVRGTRSDATDTYIDGVKVRGSANIPQSAIEQVSVLLGGVPAQYGDITGGVISITTRGAASTYFGGLEIVSSQFTDKFGYNLLGFNASGPLLQKTNPVDSSKSPFLGFFLSGELKYDKDARPSAIGAYKIKDDVLADIQANPLRSSGTTGGTYQNAEFLTKNDFEHVASRQNSQYKGATIQGKIDVNTSKTTNLTFGGTYDYVNRRLYDFDNSLFNSYSNGLALENTWRVYARFTQRFGNEASNSSESASTIKNAYYSIQLDYSKEKNKYQDFNHKDNLFDYGHVGKFTSKYVPNTSPGTATVNVNGEQYTYTGYIQNNFEQVSYDFQPGVANPLLSNYTKNYYDLNSGLDPLLYAKNSEQIKQGGGLLNGYLPRNTNAGGIYNLWTVAGAPYNFFSVNDNGMFRIRTTGSADIKNHAILVGFEYEQRDDRGFSVNQPVNLWQLGTKLVNNHIEQLDTSKATVVWEASVPTIYYERLNASPGDYKGGDAQSFFDYNVRKSLGLNPDGTDYVDFNSYAPGQYSLSYFSADELLQNNYVTYFGYDHAGNRSTNKSSFADYFDSKDEYNNLKREIGAFQPIYLAGYIQDKFDWEDLKFNVGLRVDRFDANQKVLKDPFVFFDTKKVSEVGGTHPSNIGSDYVMYVSDINNPSVNNIVGYRDGSVWYNAEGVEIVNSTVLQTSTGIAPWLVDPKATTAQTQLKASAFKDYDPQINFMPRVAFSFPISDEALFFAHYDVLTQRPNTASRLDITDYMFIKSRSSNILQNPNLKPQKTIDYELGFQQVLNRSSSIKISAFYKELRNMIQVVQIRDAFPQTYTTYGNIDFGTVKGLTLAYDLRQTGNVSLRASYTLQFADGTGSSASSGYNLATTAVGNIRTALPLSYDRRHAFTASLDYRYGEGKDYNGPVWFNRQIFANTGVNIQGNGGSGTPYTAQNTITPTAFVSGSSGLMKGSLNGSRLPFSFRVNLRVDKDINLKWGGSEGSQAKQTSLNLYVLIMNALNSKNIMNVYRATGNADDDGYLSAPQFQNQITSQVNAQSFVDLYAMKMAVPGYYSLPRMIRLGVIMNF